MTLWLLHSAQKETDFHRWIAVLLAVAFAGLTLLSLSRGAIAALAVGLAFGTVAPLLRLSRLKRPTTLIFFLAVAGFLLFFWVEKEFFVRVLREFTSFGGQGEELKFRPWLRVGTLLTEYPFGTGIGGLHAALPTLEGGLTSKGRIFFFENQILQLLGDWGIYLGSGILLLGISMGRWLGQRSLVTSNPFFFAGLLSIAVHNSSIST